jgi:hypothetical protein
MSKQDGDTSRAVVKTHVPAYQKRIWVDHAGQLEMSQSEFLRTMVQAGRSGFEPSSQQGSSSPKLTEPENNADELEARVETILTESDPLSWEELVAALTDNLEDRLDEALETLQEENRVRYSGRDGGYTLNDRS